jgi:hypothetical protein
MTKLTRIAIIMLIVSSAMSFFVNMAYAENSDKPADNGFEVMCKFLLPHYEEQGTLYSQDSIETKALCEKIMENEEN